MAFKRFEGFAGSIPQKFIDNNVRVCPMCGTTNPHWALDMKMQFKMEGNRYLFQCEQCKCVLSAPVADVTGENKTAFTTMGLFKKMSGKQNKVTYFRVEEVGAAQVTQLHKGKEFPMEEIIKMGEELKHE